MKRLFVGLVSDREKQLFSLRRCSWPSGRNPYKIGLII